MWRCRALGHRFRFASDGETMQWTCERGCGAGGLKRYPTAGEAEMYARAFDRDDRQDLGRRAPFGLFALRLVAGMRKRRGGHDDPP